MKAIVFTKYGPPKVLHLQELPKPLPKNNESWSRSEPPWPPGATPACAALLSRCQWLPARLYLGIWGPRRQILGMELAGDVEAVGKTVTRFKPGDPVFGSTFAANIRGYAEYKCLPEKGVVAIKPPNLTYAEAAALPGGE